ncbi:MAG: hypothetical protein QOD72_1064, partial [Acidimicrobiaceae bacterium]|nr:hypothetical protein [Acidimicrobiaceae bacterium]
MTRSADTEVAKPASPKPFDHPIPTRAAATAAIDNAARSTRDDSARRRPFAAGSSAASTWDSVLLVYLTDREYGRQPETDSLRYHLTR